MRHCTSYPCCSTLLQVESLRGAVRFLRSENSFIKSQDILRELEALPQYTQKEEDRPNDHLRVMAEESKVLFREAIALSSSPRVVDLSLVKPGHAWQSSRTLPENQYASQKRQVNVLGSKVDRLKQRMQMGRFLSSPPQVTIGA